jgi:hypothetical protein
MDTHLPIQDACPFESLPSPSGRRRVVYGVRAATTRRLSPPPGPSRPRRSETLEDGTVKLSPGSQSFVEVQAVGDPGGGSFVTSPRASTSATARSRRSACRWPACRHRAREGG